MGRRKWPWTWGEKKRENKRKSSFSSYSLAIINNVFPKYCTLYKLSSVSPVVLRKRFQKSILIPVVKIGFLQYFSFLSAILLLAQTLVTPKLAKISNFIGRHNGESISQWNPALEGQRHLLKRQQSPAADTPSFPTYTPWIMWGKKATPIRKVRTEY